MAMIICVICKQICSYKKDGWWRCQSGHGQRIDAAIPTENEKETK